MKIDKKKVRMQTPLVNPIIDLEKPLEKVLNKDKYIAMKCRDTMRSTSPTMVDYLKSSLYGKINYTRP